MVATGLLLFMAALTLASFALPPDWWAELLQASAKAGFVGGLADWFAVVALFRHPLGIPIPHTAIIPAQKERLGRALGRFVANQVFTKDEVARLVARLDLPTILRGFLTDPETAKPAAQAMAGLLPRLLATVEDGRARRAIARIVPRLLGGPSSGRLVARALRGLVDGGKHHQAIDFLLGEFRHLLIAKEEVLRKVIEDRVREQGGRLVGWALGATVAKQVIGALNKELDKVGPNGSEIRAAFDEWARREIDRMESDPARAAEIGRAIRSVVAHETVQAWMWDVWARARHALEADAAKPNGRAVALIQGSFANLGALLETDEAARARVHLAAATVTAQLMPNAQERIADFIAGVVASWDTRTITEKLELRVGRDLQYVRINGTLVGFLAGGALWAALTAIFGKVSF